MQSVRALFPAAKCHRCRPVHLKVPDATTVGGQYRTCVSTCKATLASMGFSHWEVAFGLKVFVAIEPRSGTLVGIRAPVHAVLRRKVDDEALEYMDPSPEVDEHHIFFIPIPTLFTAHQKALILASPTSARLGLVLIDLDELPYSAACRASDPCDALLAKGNVDSLSLVWVQDGKVFTMCGDGALSAMP